MPETCAAVAAHANANARNCKGIPRRQLSMTEAVFGAYSPDCTAKRPGPTHPSGKPGIVFWDEALAQESAVTAEK